MRRQDDEEEAVGQDSFLDVIANIVGILVLLIMVVGARASFVPITKPNEITTGQMAEELKTAIRRAAQSRSEVEGVIQKAANIHIESVKRESERMRLQTLVSAVSAEIENQRQQLTADQQVDYDIRRKLVESRIELEDLTRRELGTIDVEPEVEQIKSLPTPIAQTVSGDEVHLRLARGHIAFVPLEQLLESFQADAKQNVWRLNSQNEASNTIGPIGDFRLKYYLTKSQITVPGRGTATMIQLSRWRLLPTSPQVGEPVEQALMETSLLSSHLSRYAPSRTTVTVWVYPDSFQQYRKVKEVLYERGFATAARPLPEGIAIGGSPSGSRSSSQ